MQSLTDDDNFVKQPSQRSDDANEQNQEEPDKEHQLNKEDL